jgi:hypothetical protein
VVRFGKRLHAKHVRVFFTNAICVQDIAFREICGKEFSRPRDEKGDDDGAVDSDVPDSDPENDDPTNGACDCDENGCTPDSRPCCANKSCKPYKPDNSEPPTPEPNVPPPPSEEPEHRQPTKTMQVFWSEVSDGVSPLAWYWQIYLGEAGKGVDPCEASPINNIYDYSAPSGKNFWNDAPTTVSGQWDINVDSIDCVFFGDRLECPGANNMLLIPCTADPRPFDDCASLGMPSKAIVHCDW